MAKSRQKSPFIASVLDSVAAPWQEVVLAHVLPVVS
eukprot:SAG11_NODE_37996_length_246_cov_0.787097_1_plen_35_part_10